MNRRVLGSEGAGVNSGALIMETRTQEPFYSSAYLFVFFSKKADPPHAHLDHRLLGDGAGPPLASVQTLLDGEAAAVGFEALHQQVVDSSKVVVAFVLQRLEGEETKHNTAALQTYWTTRAPPQTRRWGPIMCERCLKIEITSAVR